MADYSSEKLLQLFNQLTIADDDTLSSTIKTILRNHQFGKLAELATYLRTTNSSTYLQFITRMNNPALTPIWKKTLNADAQYKVNENAVKLAEFGINEPDLPEFLSQYKPVTRPTFEVLTGFYFYCKTRELFTLLPPVESKLHNPALVKCSENLVKGAKFGDFSCIERLHHINKMQLFQLLNEDQLDTEEIDKLYNLLETDAEKCAKLHGLVGDLLRADTYAVKIAILQQEKEKTSESQFTGKTSLFNYPKSLLRDQIGYLLQDQLTIILRFAHYEGHFTSARENAFPFEDQKTNFTGFYHAITSFEQQKKSLVHMMNHTNNMQDRVIAAMNAARAGERQTKPTAFVR